MLFWRDLHAPQAPVSSNISLLHIYCSLYDLWARSTSDVVEWLKVSMQPYCDRQRYALCLDSSGYSSWLTFLFCLQYTRNNLRTCGSLFNSRCKGNFSKFSRLSCCSFRLLSGKVVCRAKLKAPLFKKYCSCFLSTPTRILMHYMSI
jgi:hypothetical protein